MRGPEDPVCLLLSPPTQDGGVGSYGGAADGGLLQLGRAPRQPTLYPSAPQAEPVSAVTCDRHSGAQPGDT